MPNPLPNGQEIIVTHGHFKENFQMDSMQMATDHYNIGITLKGHRRTITHLFSYSYQANPLLKKRDSMYLTSYMKHLYTIFQKNTGKNKSNVL